MKKNSSGKRKKGPAEPGQQNSAPDKTGWIRKFCGKGIFREIWKNRFVVLKGDQLFICEKEVKELGRADEVLDLSDYERCEEIRKNKSRSKKNHSKFRLQRCSSPGNMVPNQVFLAVSPEEKESWINILNTAITRAKNRILDEVMVDDSQLSHLTRDRVKIPHNRRLPTRGHLLAVASTSSSDGMLTLDLIQEEDSVSHKCVALEPPARSRLSQMDGSLADRTAESSSKSQSETAVWQRTGSAQSPQPDRRLCAVEKNCCVSMDEILNPDAKNQTPTGTCRTAAPLCRLQELIDQKLQRTEQLLLEIQAEPGGAKGGMPAPDGPRAEAQRLLEEAAAVWTEARQVLDEVQELKALYRQLEPGCLNSTKPNRKSLM
ncbi:LOW QUALITY PROTEIN: pleckstrin homology domain-containing family O member 1-like [Poeciliopsis prolifica]|uniref:LOW QUALITY PROTEIN: pleckstrin homology domain-containing family O member 1-like n=1 Tax=Poeciliopsis prolifica TaxID=188132 RepID=UPI0024142338|nr:LOW QUALITY PROTEIN: pleckstrin homology domain-containing family O member 1-like [Poeciliopsis prolifica]